MTTQDAPPTPRSFSPQHLARQAQAKRQRQLADQQLLARHDEQIRGTIADRLPSAWQATWDGPVLRVTTPQRGFAFARDLDGVDDAELDALVLRTRDFFADRGEGLEWKTYGHDRADLIDRLKTAGFVSEDRETVVIGPAADLITDGATPDGVTIRATTADEDLTAIAAMESEVWGDDRSWLADDLRDRIATAPEHLVVLVAEAEGQIVAAAWLMIAPKTDFGSLWGGSTLAAFRRRGIYRALVAERARIAVERGLTYLMVDASDDSRPILERLGMRAVTTTTPYVWTP
jgi:hypothetical protein